MSHNTIYQRSEIPDAPLYVLSNDRFMSNWAHTETEGKINTIILPCQSWEQADHVASYAETRHDQQRIRIVINKPRLRSGVVYSLLTPENAPAWYS